MRKPILDLVKSTPTHRLKAQKAHEVFDRSDRFVVKAEGDRGGHVIGHTGRGKPIYSSSNHTFKEHTKNFTGSDHADASRAHDKLSGHHMNAAGAVGKPGNYKPDPKSPHHAAMQYHDQMASVHAEHADRKLGTTPPHMKGRLPTSVGSTGAAAHAQNMHGKLNFRAEDRPPGQYKTSVPHRDTGGKDLRRGDMGDNPDLAKGGAHKYIRKIGTGKSAQYIYGDEAHKHGVGKTSSGKPIHAPHGKSGRHLNFVPDEDQRQSRNRMGYGLSPRSGAMQMFGDTDKKDSWSKQDHAEAATTHRDTASKLKGKRGEFHTHMAQAHEKMGAVTDVRGAFRSGMRATGGVDTPEPDGPLEHWDAAKKLQSGAELENLKAQQDHFQAEAEAQGHANAWDMLMGDLGIGKEPAPVKKSAAVDLQKSIVAYEQALSNLHRR